jgi:hypothetical protein
MAAAASLILSIVACAVQPIGILVVSNVGHSALLLTAEIANGRSPLAIEPSTTRTLVRSLGPEGAVGAIGFVGCEPVYVPAGFTAIMRCIADESGGRKSVARIPRLVAAVLVGGAVFASWMLMRVMLRRRPLQGGE